MSVTSKIKEFQAAKVVELGRGQAALSRANKKQSSKSNKQKLSAGKAAAKNLIKGTKDRNRARKNK